MAGGERASSNGKAPRWGMIIDLQRCVACQSCTLACKVENGTPPGIFWMRVLEKKKGNSPWRARSTYPSAATIAAIRPASRCARPGPATSGKKMASS